MERNVKNNSANRQIARAAGTVMFAFVLSNVVGLVRQILISRAFGTGDAYDAFVAASRYPDLIFNLIAGGALASSFIPVFTGFLGKRRSRLRLEAGIGCHQFGHPGADSHQHSLCNFFSSSDPSTSSRRISIRPNNNSPHPCCASC